MLRVPPFIANVQHWVIGWKPRRDQVGFYITSLLLQSHVVVMYTVCMVVLSTGFGRFLAEK